jgi:carbamoyltransferase
VAAVLGISAHYHDAAAALVIDGNIVAAIQEERLSRVKNDASLPLRAARACLSIGGVAAGALDEIVFYENPYARLERVLVSLLRAYPRGLRQFPRAIGAQLGRKLWVLDELAEGLAVPRQRVTHGAHHRSHAASAFFCSPFERAAVLTVDGVGERASTEVWLGEGRDLTSLGAIDYPHSLGLFYAAITAYLGFEVNEGEYKVMGLAAFGEPRFREEFSRLLRLFPDGSFELDLGFFGFATDTELGFGPALEALLGPRRAPGRPWALGPGEPDQRWADVAATAQLVLEEAMLGLARRARALTGAASLCLAGGVALNAVANRRLQAEAGFEQVFVQPAAGDAGAALGAAVLAALARGDRRPAPLVSASLGAAIDDDDARSMARELGLATSSPDDWAGSVAELVEQGKVVALARGRFEWGPRALGQRSLLASPRDASMRERINRVVKRREPFRPFAPAVLAGDAASFFEGAPSLLTPFMTTVCQVLPAARPSLGATTHVDGSARVQTVTAGSSPELGGVLEALGRRGLPRAVLNTSLNGPGEPICASAADAIGFFVAHPVDALMVGNTLVRRPPR